MAAARCALSGKKTCKQLEARVATARTALAPDATWNVQECHKILQGLRDGLTDSPDHRPSHCVAHGVVAILNDIGRRMTDMYDGGQLKLRDFIPWFGTVLLVLQSRATGRASSVTPAELPPAIEAGVLRVVLDAGRAICDRLHEDFEIAWDLTELVRILTNARMPRGHTEGDIRTASSFVSELLTAPIFAKFATSRFALSTGKYTPSQIPGLAVMINDLAPAHSKERYKITQAMIDAAKRAPEPTFQFDTNLIAVFQTTCGNQAYNASGQQYSELPTEFLSEANYRLVARSTAQALSTSIESALVVTLFMRKNQQRMQSGTKPLNIPGQYGVPILRALLDKHKDLDRLTPAAEMHGQPLFSGTLGLMCMYLWNVHENAEYIAIFSRPKVIAFLYRYLQYVEGHYVLNWVSSCPVVMERFLQDGKAQYLVRTAVDELIIDGNVYHKGRPLINVLVHTAAKMASERATYRAVWEDENFWISIDDNPSYPSLVHACAFLCQFPEALPFVAKAEKALVKVLRRATKAYEKDDGKMLNEYVEPIFYCFLALAMSKPSGWAFERDTMHAMSGLGRTIQKSNGVLDLEILASYTMIAYWTHVETPDLLEWRDQMIGGPFGAIMTLLYMTTTPGKILGSAPGGFLPLDLVPNEHCCLALWMILDRFPGLLLEYDNKYHKNVGGENLRKEILTYVGRVEGNSGAEWAVAKEATGEIRQLLRNLRW